MLLALGVAVWLQAQAAVVVLADSPAGYVGPVPVTCGLLPANLAGSASVRRVGVRCELGMGRGVVTRTPFGSALHAVLPAVRMGTNALRIEERPEADLSGAELDLTADGGSWESAGFRIVFAGDGSLTIGDCACRIHPPGARPGAWRERARDPVRAVLSWESPGATLYASIFAGVPGADLTLVVRGGTGGGPVLGLEVGRADASEPSAESQPESLPADESSAAWDTVVADLRSDRWEAVPLGATPVTALVRRHGPTAPLGLERLRGRFLAVPRDSALSSGEVRVVRVRLCVGAPAPDVVARPARLPVSWPGGARFGAVSECAEVARLGRKLDSALSVFRSDPRHGLLVRPEDLGDWKMDAFRFGNLEWDTSLGFLLRFLEKGERIDAAQAVAGVEHLLVCDRDPESGLFFQHGTKHGSGVIEAGHHWAEGVVLVASWLGDPWLEDDVRRLAADQVAAFGKLDLTTALPRSLGWALTALCAVHEISPDREASRKILAKLERFVLSRQGDSGHFMLERSTVREGGFRVSPFVDGGILLPALERAGRVTRTGRTADAVRRAREALLFDAVVQEKDGPALVSSILLDGRSGRMTSQSGTASGEETVLFVSGIAGGQRSTLGGLLRRAEQTLTLDERTFLGKGISMLMRALPACAGRAR